jgi:hypothetical protein
LLNAGSCGLHTLHNAIKGAFAPWKIDSLLHALHSHFYHTPARREDYKKITDSDKFPKKFCGTRWLENEPVAARALEIWPNIVEYLNATDNDSTHFVTLTSAAKDVFTLPRLHFFLSVASNFTKFLTIYQTDKPMMMFLCHDLKEVFTVCSFY